MPRATATTKTTQVDLKTCEGGFVELRTMTYGEKIERRAMVSKALMRGGGKGAGKGEFAAEVEFMNEQSTIYDFAHSIVSHNLEDKDGRALNLSTVGDIQKLDPRIGEEISTEIDALNNFEAEDSDGPSL